MLRLLIRLVEFVFKNTFVCMFLLLNSVVAKEYQIVSSTQTVNVEMSNELSLESQRRLDQWLRFSLDALKTVYGQLPTNHLNVQIKPSQGIRAWVSGSPVPWGEIKRAEKEGGAHTVLLVVDDDASLEKFKGDWTIYHELSHLLIPYDGYSDRWFSEGLASYYQNILQARVGMISEEMLWQKLYEGFERARKQDNWSHLSLGEVSDRLRETRNFMRVYWSGALYWLMMDVALRQRGDSSLDHALYELKQCCVERLMRAEDIARDLDRITGLGLFVKEFARFRGSRGIFSYDEVLGEVGVFVRDGKVRLGGGVGQVELRRGFMGVGSPGLGFTSSRLHMGVVWGR